MQNIFGERGEFPPPPKKKNKNRPLGPIPGFHYLSPGSKQRKFLNHKLEMEPRISRTRKLSFSSLNKKNHLQNFIHPRGGGKISLTLSVSKFDFVALILILNRFSCVPIPAFFINRVVQAYKLPGTSTMSSILGLFKKKIYLKKFGPNLFRGNRIELHISSLEYTIKFIQGKQN